MHLGHCHPPQVLLHGIHTLLPDDHVVNLVVLQFQFLHKLLDVDLGMLALGQRHLGSRLHCECRADELIVLLVSMSNMRRGET